MSKISSKVMEVQELLENYGALDYEEIAAMAGVTKEFVESVDYDNEQDNWDWSEVPFESVEDYESYSSMMNPKFNEDGNFKGSF